MKSPRSQNSLADIAQSCPAGHGVRQTAHQLMDGADKGTHRDQPVPTDAIGRKRERIAILGVLFREVWNFAKESGLTMQANDDIVARYAREGMAHQKTPIQALQYLINEFYLPALRLDEMDYRAQSERGRRMVERYAYIENLSVDLNSSTFLPYEDFFSFARDFIVVIPAVYERQFGRPIPEEDFGKILEGESILRMFMQVMQNEMNVGKVIKYIFKGFDPSEVQSSRAVGKELQAKHFEFDDIEALNLRTVSETVSMIREFTERVALGAIETKDDRGSGDEFVRMGCPVLYGGSAFREMATWFFRRFRHDYLKLYYYRQENLPDTL